MEFFYKTIQNIISNTFRFYYNNVIVHKYKLKMYNDNVKLDLFAIIIVYNSKKSSVNN